MSRIYYRLKSILINEASKFLRIAKIRLSPKVKAFFDYYFRIHPRDPLGGGFNGQLKRQEIFHDILHNVLLNAVLETGTYRGSTTEFFLKQTNIPVYSVELDSIFYWYSYFRLNKYTNVHLFLGDSLALLKKIKESYDFPRKGVFFYLDAHWRKEVILRDELNIIAKEFSESVIMIDDFQVPDDAGYGFDEYGSGNKFCLAYLQLERLPNLEVFFPSAHSSSETGCRRGCVILVTKDSVLENIKKLTTLRQT